MLNTVKSVVNGVATILPASAAHRLKEAAELMFWRRELRRAGGTFYNGHIEAAFTTLFGLEPGHYTGKRMLDIGCGPIGTLEWATGAARRVGADTLAEAYLALNRGTQQMEYVAAGAEALPFPDASCDVVSLFNCLDHVECPEAAIAEAQRVLAPGGDLLLIVEVDHAPTVTEPHRLTEAITCAFTACSVQRRETYRIRPDHDVYASLQERAPRLSPEAPALLCVHFRKQAPEHV